jgi:hypothetical protein
MTHFPAKALAEGRWFDDVGSVPSPGAVLDGFDEQRLVDGVVEGELAGGVFGGGEVVASQGDASYAGALETEGCVEVVRAAGEEPGVVGGFGQGAGAGGRGSGGVPDGDGEARGDLGVGAQSGAELSGQVQEGPAVLGGVELVAGEAVLGAGGAGDGFGDDGPVVVSVGAVVDGASGARAEESLGGGEGEAGEVADGVDAVLDEEADGGGADAGQFPDRAGPQKRVHSGGFHGEEASGRCEGAGHGGDHPARPGSGGGPDTVVRGDPLLTVVDGISSRSIEPPPRRPSACVDLTSAPRRQQRADHLYETALPGIRPKKRLCCGHPWKGWPQHNSGNFSFYASVTSVSSSPV